MALKDTTKKMHTLLSALKRDLDKAEKGNKAASQRVRTGSIKFEKTAKKFRKESVQAAKAVKKTKKKPVRKVVKKKKPCKPCKKMPCKKKTKKRRR